MADLKEQCASVKFCFLLGKMAAERVIMLKTAYKEDAMGKTQVYESFSHFKNGEYQLKTCLILGDP